jgi:UDPglucose 6-dehydrogenase
MRSIAIFGCGYVGLVTAACFADLGHDVYAYDTDFTKIRALQKGDTPFYEPGLRSLVQAQRLQRRLSFVDRPDVALARADVVFIAVGTPTGPTGEADLTYVRQAAREIAQNASGPLIVVNKSTVPVETADLVERIVQSNGSPAWRFSVASNPEFLREGTAIRDFMNPDRVVIGACNEQAIGILRELYEPLGAPILVVDVHTAEMIKYTANAFLAMKISFINEIANLCTAVNADIDGVVAGVGADARIGPAYLQAGLGFGGSCLPKDVAALATVARRHAIEPTMLEATLNVNRRQVSWALRLVEKTIESELFDQHIAVAGLAFKGGTDDIRESPAMVLVEALLTRGATVAVYDAFAERSARSVLRDRVRYAMSVYEACKDARALVIANDDQSFADLDWGRIARTLSARNVIDLRNRADCRAVQRAGLRYVGIGRARTEVVAS